MIRRVVPVAVLPLALIACALACSPWLRAYPSDVLAVPLFGAAVLSVIAPLVVVGVGLRRLWATALIDVVLWLAYELVVALRSPVGFDDLWTGLVHGPSQILTFALPLSSPRTLLVAPVALAWLAGALVGECLARAWHTVVPYAVLLVSFGLAYAATTRAISSASDGRRYDTLLAGALLLTLLLLRASQAWIGQERSAETTQSDSRLPLRSLVIGTVVALVVALAAAGAVQSSAFSGQPATAARTPPLNRTDPLTPISFIRSLRPADPASKGRQLFTVTVNRPTSNYVSIATVDIYDGSGWTFSRTFRPSGGVVPAEDDPTLRPRSAPVTQQYSIDAGPMTTVPWMPYLDRASRVNGTAVNIDADTGMIVPAHNLSAGAQYSVTSRTAATPFSDLPASAVLSLSGSATDLQLPASVSTQLTQLVSTLATETGVSSAQPLAYLQAVAGDFRTRYGLSGGPGSSGTANSSGAAASSPSARPTTPSTRRSSSPRRFVAPSRARRTTPRATPRTTPARRPTPTPAATTTPPQNTGGTGFADVLASIRQNRSATPEQYATLVALLARKLGVRARLVTGFRVPPAAGATGLMPGRYPVTTADAWTWVEVPVTGVGWVALDPSPGTYTAAKSNSASAVPTRSQSPTPSRSVQISKAANQTGDNGNGVSPPSRTGDRSGLSGTTVVWIVVGALAGLLVLLLLVLLLRKRLRAGRRRGSGDPRRRLVGAWQETLDVLVESGLPELEAYTSTEVATATTERFGGETGAQVRSVGDAANTAIFGPASWIGAAEADSAWHAHRVLRRAVRRQLSVGARLSATLRYHRPPRHGSAAGPTSWMAEARERAGLGAARRRTRGGGHRRR